MIVVVLLIGAAHMILTEWIGAKHGALLAVVSVLINLGWFLPALSFALNDGWVERCP